MKTQRSKLNREARTTNDLCDPIGPTRNAAAKQGRKGQKSVQARPRKARARRGTQSLVDAVNTAMTVEKSAASTSALTDRTKKSNVTCARLLREVATEGTRAGHVGPDPEILALNLPRPEDLEAEPEWVDPVPGAIWVGDHWQNPSTEKNPPSDH